MLFRSLDRMARFLESSSELVVIGPSSRPRGARTSRGNEGLGEMFTINRLGLPGRLLRIAS